MKTSFLFLPLFFLLACRQNPTGYSRIVVHMYGTSADSVILRKISLDNNPSRTIQSGVLHFSRDSLVFELPLSPDSLYQFSLKFSQNRLYCIPDQPDIRILMNKKTGENRILGSPVSATLLRFTKEQDSLIRLSQTVWFKLKDYKTREQQDSIRQLVSNMTKRIQQRFYNFGDTVSNVPSFLINFDYIDFQDDLTEMNKLVTKAGERFPHNPAISRLREEVLNLVHIREKELQPGDIFPELSLPDLDNQMVSTAVVGGKYVFIDFWASWCQNCMVYTQVKKELAADPRFKKLALISVAMDNKLKFCQDLVKTNQLPGIQLIDKDMWQGQTAAKLAFDSIPFNYLVGPDKRILAKAIPADSVVLVLKRYIH